MPFVFHQDLVLLFIVFGVDQTGKQTSKPFAHGQDQSTGEKVQFAPILDEAQIFQFFSIHEELFDIR